MSLATVICCQAWPCVRLQHTLGYTLMLIFTGALILVCSRRVWFKMSPPLSEGGKTHSSIKCVGSLNEQGSFRLLLNSHLSHGNKEIFLFSGGIKSISKLTLKIYRWRDESKGPWEVLRCFFYYSFVSWVMGFLHLSKELICKGCLLIPCC